MLARRMKFEYYRRLTLRGRRWFFRIIARNGKIVGQGDPTGYHNRIDCMGGIQAIMGGAQDAEVLEVER